MPHTLKDVLPVTATVNDASHLEIGGCDTCDLAAEFGTPLYVFDEATFRTRARELRGAFPEASVYFAAKACPALAVLQLAAAEGLGVDVASTGELHAALVAGVPPARMTLHGNNKADADIIRAVAVGIGRIAVDNFDDIDRAAAAAAEAGRRQAILLRVTPGVEAQTHTYIQTGQADSKFGLSIEAGLAMAAVERADAYDTLDLVGIHAHIGSNIFSYDPFGKTVEIMFDFLADVEKVLGLTVEEVNLGGGLGIPYIAGDFPIRLDLLAKLITETAEHEAARHAIPVPRLAFEPGRFLVGNAMVTLYSVGVVKDIPGMRTYVSVDGGMSDNIRPALYQARYAALLANKALQEPGRTVTVAGMHCESGDILVRDAALPASVQRGDVLVVPVTGAYGYSMASNYNRQPRPAVVLVKDGAAHTIVRRESLEDLLRLESPLP